MPGDLESSTHWLVRQQGVYVPSLFSPYVLSACCMPGILLGARKTDPCDASILGGDLPLLYEASILGGAEASSRPQLIWP